MLEAMLPDPGPLLNLFALSLTVLLFATAWMVGCVRQAASDGFTGEEPWPETAQPMKEVKRG